MPHVRGVGVLLVGCLRPEASAVLVGRGSLFVAK